VGRVDDDYFGGHRAAPTRNSLALSLTFHQIGVSYTK